MHQHTAIIRFYEELNDFLPAPHRKRDIEYRFKGRPSVKHAIEAHHVPHTEVDLVLVNNMSVGFDHHIDHGDRVAVYPVFEGLDISPVTRLRPEPQRRTAFLLDVHLGKLARLLRTLGFDAAFSGSLDDSGIIRRALAEERIILTRDRRLLHARVITHGYCIRSQDPMKQVGEVLRRFDLHRKIRPFRRCLRCNGCLEDVTKAEVFNLLEPKTRLYYERFRRCGECGQVYWKGSHYAGLAEQVKQLLTGGGRPGTDPRTEPVKGPCRTPPGPGR